MTENKRTTVYLDETTKQVIESQNINMSEAVRNAVKEKYGALTVLEDEKEHVEEQMDRLLERKHEIEREMRDLEKRKDKLDNLLVKNDILQQIRSNKKWRAKMNGAVKRVRRAKESGTYEVALEKNVEVLVEEHGLPFSEEKVRDLLDEMVSCGDLMS